MCDTILVGIYLIYLFVFWRFYGTLEIFQMPKNLWLWVEREASWGMNVILEQIQIEHIIQNK